MKKRAYPAPVPILNAGDDTVSHAPGKQADAARLDCALYLVATPIGNLEDITLRALRVLGQADVVACEDTRVSRKLLQAYGIATPTISYHDHNADEMRPRLMERLRGGQAVALISDAGTPLVSDPGFKLARDCTAAGLAVTVVPGPSAVLAGLSLSGLPSDRFLFAGFLPAKAGAREAALRDLAAVPATLIFFESANRLPDMLQAALAVLGDRQACIARELTKKFEEARHGKLDELLAHYDQFGPPRGEVVVVIGPPAAESVAAIGPDVDALLVQALLSASLKEAVAAVTATTRLARRDVYARALALTRDADEPQG